MKKYYYDAFISYRHKELDSFVAEKLHKLLEHYHIPKYVRQTSGKKRIERVFRDKEELSTSSDLGDNIKDALENSEYLIVVCSPDVIESQWVKQEIELFLETHSRENVLAVLISGEPDEAFPEPLCVVKEEMTGENGEKTVVCKMVEPLAADIRANTKKEMEKKLKKEVLRLLSPMLACSYDDLKQRHREYVMHRTMIAAGAAGCLMLAFTGYALHQSAKIKEQYHIALEKESQYLSEVSGDLLEKGDRMGSLENALSALPKEGEEERPLVSEAVYALNNALYSYKHDGALSFKADRMMKADSKILDRAGFSTDDSYYMEMDRTGSIYFYGGQDGKLHWKVNISELDKVEGELLTGRFFSDTKAAILTKKQIVFLDLEKKQVTKVISLEQEVIYSFPEFLAHEKYIAVIPDRKHLLIYETSSGKMVCHKDYNESDFNLVSLKDWSEDGNVLAVENEKETAPLGEKETDILLIMLDAGKEMFIQKDGNEVQEALFLDANRIAMLETRALEKYGNNRINQVRVYDYANQKDVWVSKEYESHIEDFGTELFSKSMKHAGTEKKILGFYINDLLILADEKSGEIFVENYFADAVVGVGQYDSERLLVGVRDGSIQVQSLGYNPVPLYAGNIEEEISDFQYNQKYKVTIQNLRSGNASIVSRIYEDEGMQKVEQTEKIKKVVHIPVYGEKRKVCRVMTSEENQVIVVQDIEGTGKTFIIELKDKLIGEPEIYLFEKDGKLLLSYAGAAEDRELGTLLVTVNVESGKEIYRETEKDNQNILHNICYSNQSNMAVAYSGSEFGIFRISDGKTLFSLEEEFAGKSIYGMWFSPDDKYLIVEVKKHEDEMARLERWNIEEKKWEKDEFSKMEVPIAKTNKIQIGKKKNLMAVYGNEKIWIFDIESGTIQKKIPFYGESECNFAFVNDDEYLLMYGDNQILTLWNIEKEKAVMEQKEEFIFLQEFQVDPAGKYFVANEGAGYTEAGMFLGEMRVYTLDMEQEKFYPYADVSRGWICFEKNEIGCINLDGNVYVSPIRSFETLRSQAVKSLDTSNIL